MVSNKTLTKIVALVFALAFVCCGAMGQLTARAYPMRSSTSDLVSSFQVDGDHNASYVVYDEFNNFLFEKSKVEVGDYYVSKDFYKYEVVYLNHKNHTGVARFLHKVKKPSISFSKTPSQINTEGKKIALYCTHNDESYLPTDGYYTIFGKGGIHDIAAMLQTSFENLGIEAVFDETLHLPHDNSAYSRSSQTAKKLLANNPDAMFDIHRDGIPRRFYATTYNGQEYSQVRIVVGQANPNMSANEELAIYLATVAQELYPWLILDIYYAKGHYNQNLFEKSLLFEMGTYLIEKELVQKSVLPLAHVVNVALFGTTVNTKTGDLEIGGVQDETNIIINEKFSSANQDSGSGLGVLIYVIIGAIAILLLMKIVASVYLRLIKPKYIDNNKKH